RNRITGYAGAPERLGVGAGDKRRRVAPKSPDRPDVDRVVWRGGVKLLPAWPPFFGQDFRHVPIIGRVADRHCYDPLAGLLTACELRDPLLNVANGAHASKRRIDGFQS